MKYRKKPVVVEATQWFKYGDHPAVKKRYFESQAPITTCKHCGGKPIVHGWVKVPLSGGCLVCPGDWIIEGDYYPCKPDIFVQTYKPVTEESEPECDECGNSGLIVTCRHFGVCLCKKQTKPCDCPAGQKLREDES